MFNNFIKQNGPSFLTNKSPKYLILLVLQPSGDLLQPEIKKYITIDLSPPINKLFVLISKNKIVQNILSSILHTLVYIMLQRKLPLPIFSQPRRTWCHSLPPFLWLLSPGSQECQFLNERNTFAINKASYIGFTIRGVARNLA